MWTKQRNPPKMTRSAPDLRIGSKIEALKSSSDRPDRVTTSQAMPASAARSIAPTPDLLEMTCTTWASRRPDRPRSRRFCNVVPPPETQTANRIGGAAMGGVRGQGDMTDRDGAAGEGRDVSANGRNRWRQ